MNLVSGLKTPDKRYSFTTQATTKKLEKIISLLSEKPMTVEEIANEIHVTYRHCKNYIAYLVDEKKIYVSTWKLFTQGKSTRHWPFYSAGNKKSKPKVTLSPNEKCKRYREKLKKDDEKMEIINKKRRAKRLKIKADWTAAWIMQNSSSGQETRT